MKKFISSFTHSKGQYILFANIITKAIYMLIIILMTHIIPKSVYGDIVFANTIISFFAFFMGGGLHEGMLRYGALLGGQSHKKTLFQYVLKWGLKYSVLIMVVIILLNPLLTSTVKGAFWFLILLSLQMISLYLVQIVKTYARIIHKNQLFARIEVEQSVVLLFLVIILSYILGGIGYVMALILAPFLLAMVYIYKLKLLDRNQFLIPKVTLKKMQQYGFEITMSNAVAQLLFVIDIFILGYFSGESDVAQYKTSSAFPFSLSIIALSVITSDYVKLAKYSEEDKSKIKAYYLDYLKIFFLIGVGIIGFFYFFEDYLLMLFGKEYRETSGMMFVFSIGIMGSLLFRVPLWNILSAIGWSKIRTVLSSISIIINILVCYFLTLNYGLWGTMFSTTIMMWVSGFLSLAVFAYYIQK